MKPHLVQPPSASPTTIRHRMAAMRCCMAESLADCGSRCERGQSAVMAGLDPPQSPAPATVYTAAVDKDPALDLTPALRRQLSLSLLVLYGVGITIGAGIYVLIGAVAGHAGRYAPWSFALAALAMAFTVGSYAELSTRFPVSAGEAAYVRAAFRSRFASTLTGLMTIVIGIVSSATVALGAAGYIGQFIGWPQSTIVVLVVVVLGAVACWGILESVLLASLFTLIEAGGLVAIVVAAWYADLPFAGALLQPPPMTAAAWSGIGYASLLAFFAFIGFEDLANVVEEAKVPHRDIPRAMVLTLLISGGLYLAGAPIAVRTLASSTTLARSSKPIKAKNASR